MCHNRTPSQNPSSGGCAHEQGHGTSQRQTSNHPPLIFHSWISGMTSSVTPPQDLEPDRDCLAFIIRL
jgi:hypothetical protein